MNFIVNMDWTNHKNYYGLQHMLKIIVTNDGQLLIAERKDVMPLYDAAIPFAVMQP